jgi:pimeloyl-ACP methyl ester carboxylesterase
MKIRMFLLLVALTLTQTVAVRTALAQESSFIPTATTIPCPMALPASEVEGQTVTCGQISVPEDWENAAGKQIAITYALLHSKSQSPFPDPVIYFSGGPGESPLESIAYFSSAYGKLRATRDVILFDQRGTLYSAALACPLEVELGKTPEQQAAAVAAAAGTDTAVATPAATEGPAVPVKMPDTMEELVAIYSTRGDVQTMLALAPLLQDPSPEIRCGEYFRANDVDLTKYDSVANARDAIGLLQALGYPAYNIYGISYGTRLATVVMRLYQENPDAADLPAIRTVVIDGVMPTTLNQAAENPFSEQIVALRVFADCEADAACGAAFPNIRQRTIDLLNRLSAASIETDAGTTVTLADVTGMLTGLSGNHPRVVYLPLLIDELERGVDTTFQGLKSGALPPPAAPTTVANPLDLISGRATELAGMANQLGTALNDLAQQSQSLTAAVMTEQSLAEYFLGEAERLALQRPQFGAQLRASFPDIGKTAVSEPTRATIEAFIALYGDAQQRAILTSILNVMSDDDIRVTAAVLATEQARERFSTALNNYMNLTVICNDSWGGLQDVQSFFDRFAAAEVPQLIDTNWVNLWQVIRYRQYCQSLQVTPAEMADQVQVASDIRTLVANGSLDEVTPKEWGDLVYNSLTNAISTTIPYGGHGALLQTPCGQDLAVSFITYPDAPLNTSCTEALQPKWVVPAPAVAP